MDTETRATRLATFVAQTPAAAVPDDVVAKATRHVLDTFGAALAGTSAVETRSARALTGAVARDAAFVNGIAAHALELDDAGGCDHSGAVVLPAVLAALSCADRPVTGRECVTAIVLGYGHRSVAFIPDHGRRRHPSGRQGDHRIARAGCDDRHEPCVGAVGVCAGQSHVLTASPTRCRRSTRSRRAS
nr:MmgE/PrpD family protein [Burkholderia ambifaria]